MKMVLLDFDDAVYKRHKGALEAGWMSLICPPYHLFKTRQLDDLVVQKERSRGICTAPQGSGEIVKGKRSEQRVV